MKVRKERIYEDPIAKKVRVLRFFANNNDKSYSKEKLYEDLLKSIDKTILQELLDMFVEKKLLSKTYEKRWAEYKITPEGLESIKNYDAKVKNDPLFSAILPENLDEFDKRPTRRNRSAQNHCL